MTFLPEDRRFILVANRFRWEAGAAAIDAPREADSAADVPYDGADGPRFERINCGAWFDGVQAVRTMGVDLRDRSVILELLTLRQDDGRLQMVFAGGAAILLEKIGRAH